MNDFDDAQSGASLNSQSSNEATLCLSHVLYK